MACRRSLFTTLSTASTEQPAANMADSNVLCKKYTYNICAGSNCFQNSTIPSQSSHWSVITDTAVSVIYTQKHWFQPNDIQSQDKQKEFSITMLKCRVHDIQVSVYSCLHIFDLIIYHSLNVDIAWNKTNSQKVEK